MKYVAARFAGPGARGAGNEPRQCSLPVLKFANAAQGELVKVSKVQTERRDPAGGRVRVNPEDTVLQELHQFPRPSNISRARIRLIPLLRNSVEHADKENSGTACRVQKGLANQFRCFRQQRIEKQFRQITRCVEGSNFPVRRLQEPLIDGADRLDRNNAEVVWPKRFLPVLISTPEKRIQKAYMSGCHKIGFSRKIFAEKVPVEVLAETSKEFVVQVILGDRPRRSSQHVAQMGRFRNPDPLQIFGVNHVAVKQIACKHQSAKQRIQHVGIHVPFERFNQLLTRRLEVVQQIAIYTLRRIE